MNLDVMLDVDVHLDVHLDMDNKSNINKQNYLDVDLDVTNEVPRRRNHGEV